jgi:FkbH-like protein
MVSLVEPFNKSNLARVVQLSQRSNQFNLRTIRYTDNDVLQLAASSDYMNYCFTLNDKFGENGLICVVSLKLVTESVCFIENWFMSCRVLKRTMENFVLNTIVEDLNKTGCLKLIGEYIPTAKNNLVLDHYKNLGFMEEAGKWTLSLNDYKNKETYINKL